MTRIELTKGQCAKLAAYLQERVEVGIIKDFALTELLVLGIRALRSAVDDGGGGPSPSRRTTAAAPAPVVLSPAAEAAKLKRDTLERLEAYRRKGGLQSFTPLANLCGDVDGKPIDPVVLGKMLNRERFPIALWRKVAAGLDEMDRQHAEKGEDYGNE